MNSLQQHMNPCHIDYVRIRNPVYAQFHGREWVLPYSYHSDNYSVILYTLYFMLPTKQIHAEFRIAGIIGYELYFIKSKHSFSEPDAS